MLTDREALDVVTAEVTERLERSANRLIVGITGPPGTGKSTFAQFLLRTIGSTAAFVPMDGFHLSNRQLERLGRRDRKGAPDTFDVDGYLATLRRAAAADRDVYVPDFDRRLDEPVAAGLVVPAEARLVITEGNYLALADGAWGSVRGEIDRLYYLGGPPEVRRERLIARHVAGGRTPCDAAKWVDVVDQPNADLIAGTESCCDVTLYVR
ncbi:nucleoside/nucleotide kinase family protein [Mycolicibacterium madagascariense]|uniref:Nucleoside/nucleotide kinase family protein n=1 Tax=Mycolicibacterium madagascariense TaxID=212765 RepID=A0A7I7XEN5_9MYCO|nr:nucleoside/nucleotide kinase family protein [Mycolicibacterium madagascariense]